jgi:NAD(P)-dependent dehydrogenase (short-subunit alcohol dehydrogenase family)
MSKLAGKIAVVTGGSAGIGRGISSAGERCDTPVLALYLLRDGKLARAQMFTSIAQSSQAFSHEPARLEKLVPVVTGERRITSGKTVSLSLSLVQSNQPVSDYLNVVLLRVRRLAVERSPAASCRRAGLRVW